MNLTNGNQWSSFLSILKSPDDNEDDSIVTPAATSLDNIGQLKEEIAADVKSSEFILKDDEDSCDSPSSLCSEEDLKEAIANDDLVTHLANSGLAGAAAAAAVVSVRKRNSRFCFETNPLSRKRIKTRMLRKLQHLIQEFATRVGWQAVILVATPGANKANYKVFGSQPLEKIIENLKSIVTEELEKSLMHHLPEPAQTDPSLFQLPPLLIDGIPTTADDMTQSQLRTFIPVMLKYSTGRGKPRWGRESARPPWWPKEIPWANIRIDHRSEEEKRNVSWTNALRKILISCYKYHGRKDLLLKFTEEDDKENSMASANANKKDHSTVLHTVTNPDGSMSIVQVDSNNPVIVFQDKMNAHIQGVAIIQSPQSDRTHIHAIQTVKEENGQEEGMDFNSTTKTSENESSAMNVTDSASVLVPHLYIADNGTVGEVPVFQLPLDTTAHCMLIQGWSDNASLDPQTLFPKDATLLTEAVTNSAHS